MKASVIVPMYNAKTYIGKTIDSVLPQLADDMELLIIDDGSTDGSADIVKAYLRDNVRYIRIPNSGGPSKPRNEGIRQARGEIIFVFDADDLMLPGKIRAELDAFAAHPDAAMAFTDFCSIDEHDQLLNADYLKTYDFMQRHRQAGTKAVRIASQDAYRSLAFENYVGTSSVAIRKQVLNAVGGFDETLRNSDDRDMWFRIARQYDVLYVPSVLHSYRVHTQSISHRSSRARVDSKVAVLKKQLPYAPDAGFSRQIMNLCADNYFSLAWECKKQGDAAEGLSNLFQSMRFQLKPRQFKLLASLLAMRLGIKT